MNIIHPVSREISSVGFSFYKADDVRRISVKQINNPVLLDHLKHPTLGGLYDPALGPMDKGDTLVFYLFNCFLIPILSNSYYIFFVLFSDFFFFPIPSINFHCLLSISFLFRCSTCRRDYFSCPGHFGHIDLAVPVYNPLLFSSMYKLLQSTCMYCHHLRITDTMVIIFIDIYSIPLLFFFGFEFYI